MKLTHYTGEQIRAHRLKLGLNQSAFWAYFETTQSGGSRYESGHDIPGPVQILLNIALGTEAKSIAVVTSLRQVSRTPRKLRATQRDRG